MNATTTNATTITATTTTTTTTGTTSTNITNAAPAAETGVRSHRETGVIGQNTQNRQIVHNNVKYREVCYKN